MTMHTDPRIKHAIRGLTGRRQQDIAYLKDQIKAYQGDVMITNILTRILSGLLPKDALFVAA